MSLERGRAVGALTELAPVLSRHTCSWERPKKKKKNDGGPSGRQVVTRGRRKNRGSVACGANWERDCFGAVATALSEKVTLLQRPEGKGESEPRRPPGKSLLEGGAAGRGWGVPRWSGLGPLPPPALAARLRPSSEKKKRRCAVAGEGSACDLTSWG